MIADRFGWISRGTYTYYPSILAAAEYYGFDKDDPVYSERPGPKKGLPWCPVCRHHDEKWRRFPCDVMLARAEDIEAAGYPATFCHSCARAMPVRSDQSEYRPICWACEKAKQEQRRLLSGGSVRIPDGLGCSERVPSWMADPNYGRGE
jgi:hypothetical protein